MVRCSGAEPARRWRPTWAEIDLGALAHNVALFVRQVAPAGVIAVVKADAYGHGGPEVAKAALAAGAKGLAVALVEEGVALREAGVSAPVLLLFEPPLDAFEAVLASGLVPSLARLEALRALQRVLDRSPALARRRQRVALSVDTGMHRSGAHPEHVPALAAAVAEDARLELDSLWSHLASADSQDTTFARVQLGRYREVLAALEPLGLGGFRRHLANTAGSLALADLRFDAVRIGIGLYGYLPAPHLAGRLEGKLRPVMRVRSRLSAVRVVEAGEGVSYGLHWRAPRRTVIGTVPIGYADGLPRALGERGGRVFVGGRSVPIAGTVTMDQTMVDLGPEATEQPGAEVVVLGAGLVEDGDADGWARRLGTISYEVLCGIGDRVPRCYLGPGLGEDVGQPHVERR